MKKLLFLFLLIKENKKNDRSTLPADNEHLYHLASRIEILK